MASWHSFLPSSHLEFRRKSVIGLNFDFVLLNLIKHSSYLLYNAVPYFSLAVQKQYFEKYGHKELLVVLDWHFCCLAKHSWLWLIPVFNSIQVFVTVIKYIPQAAFNFTRTSTEGFNMGSILLDFTGGLANYAQMAMQSIDQNSWVGKTLLSLVSVSFDILFMLQHYVLYPTKSTELSVKLNGEGEEPLIKSSDQPTSKNV
ncbi:hypothetical protein SLA2020_077690 [Shorea laevis]